MKTVTESKAKVEEKVIAWRRHIHEHPELSRHEFETSRYIEEQLKNMQHIELKKLTETSICGILKGN
ncbi:hypothetical protein [Kurthia sp. YJT4]